MNQEKIGKFIKYLREQKKMTQDELAEELFVDRTLISKWEKGTTSLTSEHLKSLSNYFKISADEILSGELLTKENKDKVSNITYEIYDRNLKLKRMFKTLFIIFISVLLIFLIFFFFTFYNSVSVYYISDSSNNIYINDGILIKMKDYVILKMDVNSKENIKEMNIYYKDKNNNDKSIFNLKNNNSVYIVDYIDNQEYFDFKYINDILKNMYMKVEFENDNTFTTKLEYKKIYSNKNIFFTYENQYENIPNKKNINKSKLSNKLDAVYDKYEEYNTIIEMDNIKYNVILFDSSLTIEYTNNKTNYVLDYTKIDYDYLSKSKDNIEIYSTVLEKNKCKNNSKECNTDFEVVNKILDYLIENKK
ncbi:MAG: helix-turn-helix transcriptional regulator [Bacilli bacterium]|nr:helix-turn-helix transcriptional regulator [Bacilli bacterium]